MTLVGEYGGTRLWARQEQEARQAKIRLWLSELRGPSKVRPVFVDKGTVGIGTISGSIVGLMLLSGKRSPVITTKLSVVR